MKKKIFASLLLLVMVVTLLPVRAFASTDIENFKATIGVPQTGETLDYAPQATVDPQNSASIESVTWYKIPSDDYNIGGTNTWTEVSENEVAEDGYLYKLIIKVSLAESTVIGQNAMISLNGVELEREVDSDNAYWIDLEENLCISRVFSPFPATTKLTKFESTINIPQVGGTFDYAPQATVDPQNSASIDSVTWYKIPSEDYNIGGTNTWTEVTENEIAEKGYLYKPVIKATLGENCVVAQQASVKLNDVNLEKDATDTGYSVSNNCLYASDIYSPIPEIKYLTKFEATIDKPQVGKTLDYKPKADIDPQYGATIDDIKWYKILKDSYDDTPGAINDWVMMDKDEVAQKGYLYMSVIKAPLSEDYAAAENITVKFNGNVLPESLAGGTDMYYVDDGVLFAYYTFEPSAEESTPESTNPTTTTPESINADTTTSTEVTSPQTGDNSNVPLMFTLLLAGGGVATAITIVRKKKCNR